MLVTKNHLSYHIVSNIRHQHWCSRLHPVRIIQKGTYLTATIYKIWQMNRFYSKIIHFDAIAHFWLLESSECWFFQIDYLEMVPKWCPEGSTIRPIIRRALNLHIWSTNLKSWLSKRSTVSSSMMSFRWLSRTLSWSFSSGEFS